MFDFQSPLFLLLLAIIPIFYIIQLRTTVIAAKWRRRTTFLLRCTVLLCIILALANLQRTHREQRLAVAFLLDTSESIDQTQRQIAINRINSVIAELKPTDQYGVIGLSREASVLIEMGEVQRQPMLESDLMELSTESDGTDILTTLERSLELLPDNYHRRIVLFSDGIHNYGNFTIIDYLPLLAASDVEILTVPLSSVKDPIQIQELQLPNKVRKGQSFTIQAIIETDGSIPTVSATLYHNDIPITDLEFDLEEDKNVLTLPTQQVWENLTHTYQLKLNINDVILENNQAYGVVQTQDKPNVLYVEGDFEYADSLKEVLEENGFVIHVIPAVEIPTELVQLQHYDGLILSNVSSDSLSSEQLDVIETYVRDVGHGLVAIGGDRTFGVGGSTDTALERILPVEMTPRERQESVALVFVIDTSGSMANYAGPQQKIELAIEAIRAGIRNIEDEDQAAILGFDVNKRFIASLTNDHDMLIDAVGRLKPTGGTAAMGSAIEEAGRILKNADAKRKHVILLSDVKSGEDHSGFIETVKKVTDANIGITVIGIGDADTKLLQEIEDTGVGRSVHVKNVQELPEVLMDAVRETQSYIVQEQFQPKIVNHTTPILEGIDTLPLLYGYVATAEKTAAQVFITSNKDEPILAGWNYGLGKSVAWTSDIKPAWSKEWISWSNFGKFWGQIVNWTLPTEGTGTDFDLIVSSRNGRGHVVIDTQNASTASYMVQVAVPNGTSQSVEIQQESATRYAGSFQMHNSGSYIVTAKGEGDTHKQTETLSLSYPAEYANFDVNDDLLKMLSESTGGIYEPTISQITNPEGTPIESRKSLSHTLLIIAVVLFVLEMILRRFSIASGYLAELRAQFRRQSETVIPDSLSQLTQKKGAAVTISNSEIYTQVENISSREDVEIEAVPEITQPVEGAMTRLLTAKRRSTS
ncbi:MAG: VWA domain-containing protein [Candidatus Poribacteria bacterium]|nr:VWA domain-containing protein [Candidatus Poribacteria bacterium]